MNTAKIVAKILFYFTRFLALVYFAMSVQSVVSLITGWSLTFKEGKKYFQICFPFTQTPYLVGDYNTPYIVYDFLMPLSLYGLFFLLLSNVFKVFFQPKLFTANGIRQLTIFYLVNFIVPIVAIALAAIFADSDELSSMLLILHFVIGIFAYFLATIFKQGLHLQNEQDLFV